MQSNRTTATLQKLLRVATDFGATDAVLIPVDKIVVEDGLAEKCTRPRCINYGLSKSCPPHVGGPEAIRKRLETVDFAIFFKIEVPSSILYSGQGRELFQLLHETAARIEQEAVKMGFSGARGYAGNSCKKVFCRDFLECRVIGESGQCRNPDRARQSMSGFGINVAKLYEAAGWPFKNVVHDNGAGAVTGMSSLCGLVLL